MSSAELTASVPDICFLKDDQKSNEMKTVVIYSRSCLLQDSDPDSALLRAVLHCTLARMPLKRAELVLCLRTTLQGVWSSKSQTLLALWIFFFKSEKNKSKKRKVFSL